MQRSLFFLLGIVIVIPSYAQLEKRIQQAEKLLFLEQFEEAYVEYSAIEEEFGDNVGVDYHKEITYLLSVGRGESTDKIKAYEKVKGTQDRIYYYWLGRIYFENYEFSKAYESFDKFLAQENFKSKSLVEDAQVFIEWCREARTFYENPNEFEIVPLPATINSKYADISPSFFGDNNELLFMSSRASANNDITAEYGVYHSERIDELNWKLPTRIEVFGVYNLLNAKVEVVNQDGRAFVYRDGRLRYSEPEGSEWSGLKTFDSKIRSSMIESHFFINDDEDVIFFSSDKGGEGVNLYQSRKDPETGEWSEPSMLPPTINSNYYEDSPYLSHDGKYLYFSSNRESSIGGYDIFRSEYDQESGNWGPAENLGYPINTVDDEIHFQLNEDNVSGYFSSNRLHSQGDYDIYFFKKEQMVTIAGTILDSDGNTLPNHQVWFRPVKYPDEAFRSSTDAKGRYVTKIFLNEPFFVEVEFDDVKVHSTNFTSTLEPGENQIFKDFTFEIPDHHPAYEDLVVSTSNDDIRRQEDELQSLEFIGSKYRSASSININNIYFEFESASIKEESMPVVDKVLQMMREFPTISIEIAGHTDNIGTHDFNMELSKRRAESLKNALTSRGVQAQRINTVGYGETRPLVSNDNEFEGRELNRRIEITVIDPSGG